MSANTRGTGTLTCRGRGAIKFAPNKTTGVSPFKMLHGFEARLPIDTLLPVKEREMEAERQDMAAARAMVLGQEMEQIWQHVQKQREKMQEAMKKQFDKGHTPAGLELDMGRKVLLEVKRLLFAGGSTKLHERWQGPYEVVEKRGDLNRVVKGVNNPEDCQLVHVERLKPFIECKEEGSHKEEKKDKIARERRTSRTKKMPRLRRRSQKANSRSRRSCRSGRRTARWSTSSGRRASHSAATPGPRPRACMQMNYYRGSFLGRKCCRGRR